MRRLLIALLWLVAGCGFVDGFKPGEPLPPTEIHIDYTTPRGLAVDMPSWAKTPEDYIAIGAGLDRYLELSEARIQESIPAAGLVVVLIDEPRINPGGYAGYYWAQTYPFLGTVRFLLRVTALAWDRTFLGGLAESPFPWFPHELGHDLQARRDDEVSHPVDPRLDEYHPDVKIKGSW